MSSARRLGTRIATWIMLAALAFPVGEGRAAARAPDVVLRWNAALLQAVRTGTLGPPMVSRALAIAHTCMYDAWAAYDARAIGTRLGGDLRRPARERTIANKSQSVSFAAYRAAVDLYPAATPAFASLMTELGYDPDDTSVDTATPAGIGNVACDAVLDFRHADGSNQLGDHPAGAPGVPYADYTGYAPANPPMDLTGPFDPATVHDHDRWQPLSYLNAAGQKVTPAWLAHHWGLVTPFAMTSASQFRSPAGPALQGAAQYRSQALDVLEFSANLTDKQKMISEYWADGPASETPPGHWNLLARFVSERDRLDLDANVKLFFALNNAMLDAGICAWDNKVAYDSVRPITAIRYLFHGQSVTAWAGPFEGTKRIDGGSWLPYQRSTFPTPPFGEFASGHSTFSAAAAEVLRRFTRSDRFGMSAMLPAGSSAIEAGVTPASDVRLRWKTFTDAADQAGLSRRFGGIHFERGDLEARAAGRLVGAQAWAAAVTYFKSR